MDQGKLERIKDLRNKEAYIIEREYDLAYLKFTIILMLLVIIIFYITCKFNIPSETQDKTKAPIMVTQLGTRAEHYTPNPSILKNDIFRSDPAFDMTKGYMKEGYDRA